MDQLGIDIHVLTIPAPGADRFEGQGAIEIARVANDAIAAIARKHPKRFIGFFTLPTCNIQARSMMSSSVRSMSSVCAASAVSPI